MMTRPGRAILVSLGCAILAAIVYIPSVKAPFVYDDRHAIFQNPAVLGGVAVKDIMLDPSAFSARPGRRMYRPLTLLSYRLNYAAAGFKMQYWHGLHIALHALNALLLFFIAKKLLGSDESAAAATLLWALHPLGSEAVIYQAARSSLLASTTILAGFLAHVSMERGWKRSASVVTALVIGLLCKETAIVLPALVVAYDFCFAKDRAREWKSYVPVFAVVAAYFVFRRFALDVDTVVVTAPVRPVWSNLLSQSGAAMLYLSKTLWPFGLSVEHDLPSAMGATTSGAWWQWPLVAMPILMALGAATVVGLRKSALWAFGIAWWAISLAPESSLVPLVQVANERRMYLPLAGLAIAVVALVGKRAGRGRAALVAVVAMMAMLNVAAQSKWRSVEALWASTVRTAPTSIAAWHGLASAELDAGRVSQSKKIYAKIVREAPDYYGAKIGLARILIREKNFDDAIVLLQDALRIDPSEDLAWITMSDAYLKSDRVPEAENAARKAVEANPVAVEGWNNLGVALARSGRIDEAFEALDRAVTLNPAYAIGYLNRGNAHRVSGNIDAARADYRRALELDPTLDAARKSIEALANIQ